MKRIFTLTILLSAIISNAQAFKGKGDLKGQVGAVHNIKLVWDDANLIEGRVENQHIYILTQYVKKTK